MTWLLSVIYWIILPLVFKDSQTPIVGIPFLKQPPKLQGGKDYSLVDRGLWEQEATVGFKKREQVTLWEWYGNSMGPAYHKGVHGGSLKIPLIKVTKFKLVFFLCV